MDGGDSAGGSSGLAELIDKFGEQILADLQSEYGVNLAQALRPGGGYSPRTILVLIRQLPPESRTVAAMRGGEQFHGWGADRYLLANVVDAINYNTYALVSANAKRKPKAPVPTERPSKTPKRGRDNSTNPFRQQLAAAKKAQGG